MYIVFFPYDESCNNKESYIGDSAKAVNELKNLQAKYGDDLRIYNTSKEGIRSMVADIDYDFINKTHYSVALAISDEDAIKLGINK